MQEISENINQVVFKSDSNCNLEVSKVVDITSGFDVDHEFAFGLGFWLDYKFELGFWICKEIDRDPLLDETGQNEP